MMVVLFSVKDRQYRRKTGVEMIKQPKIFARAVVLRIVSLALLSALIVLPVSAIATPEEELQEVTPFEAMTLVVRRLPTTYIAAATGFLDPDIELPVTVEIAVPAGASIIWFGEPSGGPITDDPKFDEPFDLRSEDNLDIYRVTLENYPQVQIEYNLAFSPVAELADGSQALRMEYTPLTELQALRFITNLPIGSEVLDENIEFFGLNEENEPQFGYTFRNTRAGEMYTITVLYQGDGAHSESGVIDGLLITAAIVLCCVAVVLVLVLVTKRRRAANEEWEEYEED